MYIYIYKITNKLNNKEYIGVHSTLDLDDGYMGSGNLIIAAIKKYGKENFTKEILQYFNSPKEAFAAERNIVNESYIQSENTYNINLGGSAPPNMAGIPRTEETKNKISSTRKERNIYPTAGIEASRIANTGKEPANKGKKANAKSIEKRTETRKLIKFLFSQQRYDELLSLSLKPTSRKRIREKINLLQSSAQST